MPKEMVASLFQGTNLSLGARIEFVHHWSEWIKSIHDEEAGSTSSLVETVGSEISHATAFVSELQLDLFSILKSNQYGLTVIETYRKTKSMNENLRKILGKAVLHYFIDGKFEMSVKDSENIAKQIVDAFPGEIMVNIINDLLKI